MPIETLRGLIAELANADAVEATTSTSARRHVDLGEATTFEVINGECAS